MKFNPRVFCIFCAIAAAIVGLMLAFGPFPVGAQEKPAATSTFEFLDGPGAVVREIEGRLTRLGSGDPVPDFRLMVLAHYKSEEGELHRHSDIITDKDGKYLLRFGPRVTRLRLFAYGEFVIPDVASNVPLENMKFNGRETFNSHLRPLKRVWLEGTVTRAEGGKAAGRAGVYLAPLEPWADGSMRMTREPFSISTDVNGRYRLELPPGHYRVWANWADQDTDNWEGYFGMVRRLDVFADTRCDIRVSLGKMLTGRVSDARDGKGIAAWIDLYSNAFMRQLTIPSADGESVDERRGDEEIRWPVGDFKFRLATVDPDDFTAVVRPRMNHSVIKIFPGLKLADLEGKRVDWKLYTPDQIQLDIQITTHERNLPAYDLDVRVQAVQLDDPGAIRAAYSLGGRTDDHGRISLIGLAPGQYTVYGESGTTVLGELRVTRELRQSAKFKIEVPFATGTLKYEDGTICRNALCVVQAELPGHGYYSDRFVDPFPSSVLRERGIGFVRLLLKGGVFTLRFYANDKGKEVTDDMMPADCPFVTDEVKFTVDGEKAFDFDLVLKPQAKKPPKDG